MQECADLLRRGFSPDSNSATRAIGYRQGMEALLRWRAHPPSLTLPSTVRGRLPGSSFPQQACRLVGHPYETVTACWPLILTGSELVHPECVAETLVQLCSLCTQWSPWMIKKP